MTKADVALWAMSDSDGRCPGDVGPCMHFYMMQANPGFQKDEELREVWKTYQDFVKACRKAEQARRKVDDSKDWKVGILFLPDGPRFAYTYEEPRHEGEHVHASVAESLMHVAREHGGGHGHGEEPKARMGA